MSEETKDNFQKGVFWELYLDLERQFQDFLEYLPYLDGNEDAYSFRLMNLILNVGGHVDSAFKEMTRYSRFSDNPDCQEILASLRQSEKNTNEGKPPRPIPIGICLKAFEKEYRLSKREIEFKRLPERETIAPFEPYNPKTNAPEWWDIYNGLKHDASRNLKKANLRNTRDALAGAFLLNVIHIPAALRLYEHDILRLESVLPENESLIRDFGISPNDLRYLRFGDREFLEMLENQSSYSLAIWVETPIFRFDFPGNRPA